MRPSPGSGSAWNWGPAETLCGFALLAGDRRVLPGAAAEVEAHPHRVCGQGGQEAARRRRRRQQRLSGEARGRRAAVPHGAALPPGAPSRIRARSQTRSQIGGRGRPALERRTLRCARSPVHGEGCAAAPDAVAPLGCAGVDQAVRDRARGSGAARRLVRGGGAVGPRSPRRRLRQHLQTARQQAIGDGPLPRPPPRARTVP